MEQQNEAGGQLVGLEEATDQSSGTPVDSEQTKTANELMETARKKMAEFIKAETKPKLEFFQNQGIEISDRIERQYQNHGSVLDADIEALSKLNEEFSQWIVSDCEPIFREAANKVDDPLLRLIGQVDRHKFSHIIRPLQTYLRDIRAFQDQLYLSAKIGITKPIGDVPRYQPVDLEKFSYGRESYIRVVTSDLRDLAVAGIWTTELNKRTSDIEVAVDMPETPVMVQNENNLFFEVVGDLVDNAVEAMPNGGDLAVKLEQVGNEAILSIADTGDGISAENLDKVQNEGFSTKGTTGMGLALAKRYFENFLGGKFSIESSTGENHGTKISIKLPVKNN